MFIALKIGSTKITILVYHICIVNSTNAVLFSTALHFLHFCKIGQMNKNYFRKENEK